MIKPIETRTCECCGSTIGTYRFTVSAEFYQEVEIEAPDADTAIRKLQDELDNMSVGPIQNWFGADLRAYDEDGDQVAGD